VTLTHDGFSPVGTLSVDTRPQGVPLRFCEQSLQHGCRTRMGQSSESKLLLVHHGRMRRKSNFESRGGMAMGARCSRSIPLLLGTNPMTLPGRTVNAGLSKEFGRDVLAVDVIAVEPGDLIEVRFVRSEGLARRGLWLGTNGSLEIADTKTPQVLLWNDTAPEIVTIRVTSTDGFVRLYNIWESSRGRQSLTPRAGMVAETVGNITTYACTDPLGEGPSFGQLVVALRVIPN
jgi:hypothetical protein